MIHFNESQLKEERWWNRFRLCKIRYFGILSLYHFTPLTVQCAVQCDCLGSDQRAEQLPTGGLRPMFWLWTEKLCSAWCTQETELPAPVLAAGPTLRSAASNLTPDYKIHQNKFSAIQDEKKQKSILAATRQVCCTGSTTQQKVDISLNSPFLLPNLLNPITSHRPTLTIQRKFMISLDKQLTRSVVIQN